MAEFFHMGGFGAFIWSAMGVALTLMLIEPLSLRLQRKSVLKTIKQKQRFEQKRDRDRTN